MWTLIFMGSLFMGEFVPLCDGRVSFLGDSFSCLRENPLTWNRRRWSAESVEMQVYRLPGSHRQSAKKNLKN